MKKNKMMRTASGLLALTLLTTGVISGTFAKYTTEDSAYDVARVAKWGVTLQAVGSLYGEKYADQASGNKPMTGTGTFSVASTQLGNGTNANGKKSVAPGTKNDTGFSFSLNGTPEVSSEVTMDINSANIMLAEGTYGVMVETSNVTAENFESLKAELYVSKDAQTFTQATTATLEEGQKFYTLEDKVTTTGAYYPVEYKLESTTKGYNKNLLTENSIAEIAKITAEKIDDKASNTADTTNAAKAIYSVSKKYDPNQPLSDLDLAGETITWNWEFTDNKTNVGDSASINDMADTILGNLMAKTVDVETKGTDDFKGIVVAARDNGYKAFKVDKDTIKVKSSKNGAEKEFYNYYATVGDEADVTANLSTYFYIDITVTQVD